MAQEQKQTTSTPLMAQYAEIKARHTDSILFFRLGDFYEMFGEDAKAASGVLEVALTKRQGVPMCGVPYHAANTYILKLLKKGFKVSICEQKGDAAFSQNSKLFKREVVRIITPGTILEENILRPKKNNFLASVNLELKGDKITGVGIAFADISTGRLETTEISGQYEEILDSELSKYEPSELILSSALKDNPYVLRLVKYRNIPVSFADEWDYNPFEAENSIKSFFELNSLSITGLENKHLCIGAVNAILKYLKKTQPENPKLLNTPRYYNSGDSMMIDSSAVENLEILPKQSAQNVSLLENIDETITPMGGRLFRNWVLSPLTNSVKIKNRQDCVRYFMNNGIKRNSLRQTLKKISDIERILNRLQSGRAYPRDLNALKDTLTAIPEFFDIINSGSTELINTEERTLSHIISKIPDMENLLRYLETAVPDEPPATFKQGGYVKKGFSNELDELKGIMSGARQIIAEIENEERRKTGINNLKIGYTGVFGYYIEVTKSYLNKVPVDYIRKQTLSNAERFVTEELKESENKILNAEEKALRLEDQIFEDVKSEILRSREKLITCSELTAELDCYSGMADLASRNNYCIPVVNDGQTLRIIEGRHPVVERNLPAGETFIENDIFMDGKGSQVLLITGPNMSGKSTYLRQTALIVIMAQIGSGVPAKSADIGIVDQIFTRIGASDNLAKGESTFMVEMRETSTILHNLTPRSLVILDEVGRGTSTYDGISIAWAIVEYLVNSSPTDKEGCKPKVLFATHYFELTALEEKLFGVLNYNVSVKEWGEKIVFLKKIVRGSADKSYGIHVAALAGIPEDVIKRSYEIISGLEKQPEKKPDSEENPQLKLFEQPSPIIVELTGISTEKITPLDALNILTKWKVKYTK